MWMILMLAACRSLTPEGWPFTGKIAVGDGDTALDHCVIERLGVPTESTARFEEQLDAMEGTVSFSSTVGPLSFTDVIVQRARWLSLDARACTLDEFLVADLVIELRESTNWIFRTSGVAVSAGAEDIDFVWAGVPSDRSPFEPPPAPPDRLLWAVDIQPSGDGTMGWWLVDVGTGQVTNVETELSFVLQ